MSELVLVDRAGRPRSPATMPGFHTGRPPRNKGLRYPANRPKIEEIIAVMRTAGDDAHGRRLRGLIVVLWRAGLRIQEALALAESDLEDGRRLTQLFADPVNYRDGGSFKAIDTSLVKAALRSTEGSNPSPSAVARSSAPRSNLQPNGCT